MGAVPSRESHEDPSSACFANCGNLVVLHVPLTRHFFPSPYCRAFRQLRDARNNQSALYSFDVRRLDQWLPGAPAEAFRAAQTRDHGEEVAEEDPSMHYLDDDIEKAQEEEIALQARARLAEGSSDQNGEEEGSCRARAECRAARDAHNGKHAPQRPPRCSIESLHGLYKYLVIDAEEAPPVSASASPSCAPLAQLDLADEDDEEAAALEAQYAREESAWVPSPWTQQGVVLADTNADLCAREVEEQRWREEAEAWQRQQLGEARDSDTTAAVEEGQALLHHHFMCPVPVALAVRLSSSEVQAARHHFRSRPQSSAPVPPPPTSTNTEDADDTAVCALVESQWPVPIPAGHIVRRRHAFERDPAYKDGRLHLVEEEGVLYYFAMNPRFVEPEMPEVSASQASGLPPLSDFVVEPCQHTSIQYSRSRSPASAKAAATSFDSDDDGGGDDETVATDRPRASRSTTSLRHGECERCGARVERCLEATAAGIPMFPSAHETCTQRFLVPITPVRIVGVHGTIPSRSRGTPWLRGREDAAELDAYIENTLPPVHRPPVLRLCRFVEGAIGEKILNRATLVTLLTYRLQCQRAGLADALVRPVWTSCTLSNIPFLQMVRETFFRARAAVAEIDDHDRTLRDWLEQFDVENNFMCFINRNLGTVRDYAPPERQLRVPSSLSSAAGAVSTTTTTSETKSIDSQVRAEAGAAERKSAAASRGDARAGEVVSNDVDAPFATAPDGGRGDGGEPLSPTAAAAAPPPHREHHRRLRAGDGDELGEKGAIGRPEGHIPRDAEENGEDVYNEDDLSKLVIPPEKPNFRLFSSRVEPHAPVSIDALFAHDIREDRALPPEALPGYVQRDLLDANQRRQEQPRDERRPSHALYEAGMRQSTRGRQLLFQLRADCLFALMYYCSQAAAPIFIGAYIEPVDTTPLSYGGAVRLVEPQPQVGAYAHEGGADLPFAQMAPLEGEIATMVEEYFLEKELITVFSVSDCTRWARGPDAAHSLHKLLLPAPVDPESPLGRRQAEERQRFGHVCSYALGDFRDADLVVYNSTLRCWEHYEHVQIRRRFNWTAQQQQQQQQHQRQDHHDDDDSSRVDDRDEAADTSSVHLGSPEEAPPLTLTQRQQRAIDAAGVSAVAPQDPASMSARLLCVGLDELLLSWTKWVVDNRFYEDRNDPGWLRLNLNAPWPPEPLEADPDASASHNAAGVSVHALVRRGRYYIWSFRHNDERYFYGVIPKFAKDRLRRQKTHYRQRKKKAAQAAAAAAAAVAAEATTTNGLGETQEGQHSRKATAAARSDERVSATAPRRQNADRSDEGSATEFDEVSTAGSPEPGARRASRGQRGRSSAASPASVAAPSRHAAACRTPSSDVAAQPAPAEEAVAVRTASSPHMTTVTVPGREKPAEWAVEPMYADPNAPPSPPPVTSLRVGRRAGAKDHPTACGASALPVVPAGLPPPPQPHVPSPHGASRPWTGPEQPLTAVSPPPAQRHAPQISSAQKTAYLAPPSLPYGALPPPPPPPLSAVPPPRGVSPTMSSPTTAPGTSFTGPARYLSSSLGHGSYSAYPPPSPAHVTFAPSSAPQLPPPHLQASLAYHRNGVNTFMQANKRHENEYYPPLPTNPTPRVFPRSAVQPLPGAVGAPPLATRTAAPVGMGFAGGAATRFAPGTPTGAEHGAFASSAHTSPPNSGRSTPRVQVRVRTLKGTPLNASSSARNYQTVGSYPSTPVGSYMAAPLTAGSPHTASIHGGGMAAPGSVSAPGTYNPPLLVGEGHTHLHASGHALACSVPSDYEDVDGRVSPTSMLPPNLIQDGSKTRGESYLRTEANSDTREMRSAFRWNPYSRRKGTD